MAAMATARIFALTAVFAMAAGLQAADYEYRFTDWSDCSDHCRQGKQHRALECVRVGRAGVKKVRASRCEERGVPKPEGELSKDCFGAAGGESYCLSCNTDRKCQVCAPGFDVQWDGSCVSSGLAVVLELTVDERPDFAWQSMWRRRKLDACLEGLVAAAGGVPRPLARAYAVLPSEAFGATIHATVPVPQGVSAHEFRAALEANFTTAAWNLDIGAIRRTLGQEEFCPRSLDLSAARLLCPGSQRMDEDGNCAVPLGALKARAWMAAQVVGALLAVFLMGSFAHCYCERRYRMRLVRELLADPNGNGLQMSCNAV